MRLLFLAAAVGCPALASTVIPHTLVERAAEADRVVVARVVRQWTEGRDGRLKTLTEVSVDSEVKGAGPARVTVVQIGGRSGAHEVRIPGDASFSKGESVLLFLRCHRVDRCALVALGEGRLAIRDGRVEYRDLFTGAWRRRPLPEVIRQLGAVPPRPGGNHL